MIPVILRATVLEAAMMGQQSNDQASLFYEFRLEVRIPKDHLLRRINVFVTPVFGDLREQLQRYCSEIGRRGAQTPWSVDRRRQALWSRGGK
jgi:hypothetical protein